jgi:hypothetical protein
MLWNTPPGRWPLSWHVLAALLALGALAATATLALKTATSASGHELAEVQRLTLQLRASRTQSTPLTSPSNTLVPDSAARADDVVRDVGHLARELGVDVTTLTIFAQPATARETGWIQFSVQAGGNYTALKTWLSQLLARYDRLALTHLQIRASAAGAARVDSDLTLVLYVRD